MYWSGKCKTDEGDADVVTLLSEFSIIIETFSISETDKRM